MDEPFDTTTQRKVSIESGSAAETRLPDRWLPLARLAWGIVAVLTLTIFIASLPVYLAQLQITCVGVSCASGQLTPPAARGLLNLGLSMSSYTLLIAIFIVASALVWFGVAMIIIWRKSDDRMGLLVALMLILQGTNGLTGNMGGGQSIWRYPSEAVNYFAFVLPFLVFCLFPNGKFVPRWMKWLDRVEPHQFLSCSCLLLVPGVLRITVLRLSGQRGDGANLPLPARLQCAPAPTNQVGYLRGSNGFFAGSGAVLVLPGLSLVQ